MDEHEFYVSEKVLLRNSDSKEEFEIVSWNDSEQKGRIEDKNGRGWYVRASQIKPSPNNTEEDDWDEI